MKLKPVKRIPALIALTAIALVCSLGLLRLDFIERIERITYDMRVREALKFPHPIATNLAFVHIDDESIDFVRTNTVLGYRFGLYWPRQVYGRLARELAEQGAKAVAFDVIFAELRPDHAPVKMEDGTYPGSDDFFAQQIRRATNVILAVSRDMTLPDLFRTNAMALGDISTDKDQDGVLRRAKPFRMYRQWHRAFEQVQAELGFKLADAKISPREIVLSRSDGTKVNVPLDEQGNFQLADFGGDKLPPGMQPKDKPFTDIRMWNMGVVLAAHQLQANLLDAEVGERHITLRCAKGTTRTIPLDAEGYFYIDWALPFNNPYLTQTPVKELLLQERARLEAQSPLPTTNLFQGKLVIVGSSALGNDLTDRGATPLRSETLLVSKHWNIANSILTGRFVRRAPIPVELGLIILLGLVATFLTLELSVPIASGLMFGTALAYIVSGVVLYVKTRYWIPLVLPVSGGLLLVYICLVAWRVVFEQAELRRVKSIFSEVVSPKIMKELLHAPSLSLGGARREVTVLFADVRGFTQLTDVTQERAVEFVKSNNLTGEAAEAWYDEQARETLETVNVYLGIAADIIIKQDGVLDKFIGDCVMAFWGTPTPNARHAVAGVRAAIEAQRAIDELNRQRAVENKRRELENKARLSAGLKPKPILPLLLLGTGINTGMATAGLMGSKDKQKNYTVFGREVNLASRLETLSGHGHIFISSSTYNHLLRDDPALAAGCVAQGETKLKGFGSAVQVYEVPWQQPHPKQMPEAKLAPAA